MAQLHERYMKIMMMMMMMNFLVSSSKDTRISNFMKIRPVGDELFHADGQTDRQTDRHDEANRRLS